MTRRRAAEDGTPRPLMLAYYAQRAAFGMIVTEGTYPSTEGRAYPRQPGILDTHVDGWREITDAVHDRGGSIVLQLMHAGRLTQPDITGGPEALAPSAVRFEADHVAAARRAIDAGFDGVEFHGANGYLLQQFLAPNTNRRHDAYGGSPAARARFVIDVLEATAAAVGGDRVGVRLSPGANIQGTLETDADDLAATYTALAHGVRLLDLAYVSMIHPDIDGALVQHLRRAFAAPLVANTGFPTVTSRHDARRLLDGGAADVVAVGRPAIANPDLAHRWRTGTPETVPAPATLYTADETGYTDYPTDHPTATMHEA